MIKVIETFRKKEAHSMFNGNFLEIICSIFENEKVVFYGEQDHINTIKKYVKSENIEYKNFFLFGNFNLCNKFFLYFKSTWNDIKELLVSKKKDVLFYTTTGMISLIFLKIINKFLKRKVLLICHGELEYLLKRDHPNFSKFYKILIYIYSISFWKIEKDYIIYIVLGDSIKENLLSLKQKIDSKKIISIDHPYYYKTLLNKNSQKNKFGIVGLAGLSKNSHKIFELASNFKTEISNQKIEFMIIGKVKSELEAYKNNYVEYTTTKEGIPREKYDHMIEELNYILFFYPKNSYKLIASGAFFDSILFEKPIIAIKNDFFNYYFKKYGPIGYLCNDLTEIKNVVSNIINNKDELNQDVFINNIKKIKKELSLENIKNDLEKKLKDYNII